MISDISGDFKDDKKHGQGTYSATDGHSYTGAFANNKYNGYGIMLYKSGPVSMNEGHFLNGAMDGQGARTWADKSSYRGTFDSGRITGKGVKVFANGDVYEGLMLDGKMHGVGELRVKQQDGTADAVVKKGEWVDDVYSSPPEERT